MPHEFYAACEGYQERQKESAMVIRFASFRIAEAMAGSKAIGIYGGLAVGDSYQGGTIAYIDGTGEHGIIVAWTDDTHINIWGGNGVIGATADTLYGGLAPTDLIEAAWTTSAGWDTRQLTNGGYTDWCLPTIVDWDNIAPNSTALGIPNLITYYWTCIERDATTAWIYDPNSGEIFDNKSGPWSYLAVRYF